MLVRSALVLLHRLDTHDSLQPLTEADLRQTAAGRDDAEVPQPAQHLVGGPR
ncbi:hypothetical protein [Streptomyces anandii]|uniref:hypothetical protein n=1 Tax=Streptomyces anandii TaxID=285454 RepID=UPI00167BC2FA|nr:hypothetical protein [Streptomyces anandii]